MNKFHLTSIGYSDAHDHWVLSTQGTEWLHFLNYQTAFNFAEELNKKLYTLLEREVQIELTQRQQAAKGEKVQALHRAIDAFNQELDHNE